MAELVSFFKDDEKKEPTAPDSVKDEDNWLEELFKAPTDEQHWYFRHPLTVVFAALLLCIVGINIGMKEALSAVDKKGLDKAVFYYDNKNPDRALTILSQLRATDSLNIDYHYYLISSHFDLPERIPRSNYDTTTDPRDDDSLRLHYAQLASSNEQAVSDIGLYGNGLIARLEDGYQDALTAFGTIKNPDLKYLNNSIGSILMLRSFRVTSRAVRRCFLTIVTSIIGSEASRLPQLMNCRRKLSQHRNEGLWEERVANKLLPRSIRS